MSVPFLTCAFIPESSEVKFMYKGRSSDLLHLLCLPVSDETVAWRYKRHIKKLTASGNVQDFHLIPFSFREGNLCGGKCRKTEIKCKKNIRAGFTGVKRSRLSNRSYSNTLL